jgi:hypothetical protein
MWNVIQGFLNLVTVPEFLDVRWAVVFSRFIHSGMPGILYPHSKKEEFA